MLRVPGCSSHQDIEPVAEGRLTAESTSTAGVSKTGASLGSILVFQNWEIDAEDQRAK